MKAYMYETFHRCESITDWTPLDCALALSSTQKVEGKHSIKMTADNALASAMWYTKTVDWSDFHDIVFSVYHPGWTNEIGWLELTTDGANYKIWEFDFAAEWTEITIDLSSTPLASEGTLDLSNIVSAKIYQRNFTTPGEDYYFDNFRGRTLDVSDYVEQVRIRGGIFPIRKVASFLTHPDDEKYFRKKDTLEILDDSDELIFSGFITDKNRGIDGLYRYVVNSYFNEAHALTYVKEFSSDKSSEKIQDIVDNSFDFIKKDSSITATTIDYDYSLNRQPAALLNLIRFLERQVISIDSDGVIRTKDYDDLTKAPQHFPGTYNFRDDEVGSEPSGWTSSNGADCITTVIASFDGHRKVLQLFDNNAGGSCSISKDFVSSSVTGSVEIWVAITDATKELNILFNSSVPTQAINFKIESDRYYEYSAGAYNLIGVLIPLDSTLIHLRFDFDCTTDTYDLYINGSKELTGKAFRNVVDNINSIRFDTEVGDSAYYCYVDALGISWDANYNVGDNKVAWNLNNQHQSVMLIEAREFKTGYYRGSLGITRASVRMAGNVIRTKPDDRTDTEQAIGVNPLKEYRDLKLVANAEADQLATNLFEIFSLETEFIALRVEGEGFTNAGETLEIANTGSIPIAQGDFCLISYVYDPKSDIYLEMIVSNNVVLPAEFTSNFDTSQLQIHQANLQTFENATDVATNATNIENVKKWTFIEPTGWAFTDATLTDDGTWNTADISAIVPVGTEAIILSCEYTDNALSSAFFRGKNDNAYTYIRNYIQVIDRVMAFQGVLYIDSQEFDYNFSANCTSIYISVVAYYK